MGSLTIFPSLCEPRREKTGLRVSEQLRGANRPVKSQKQARGLKFRLYKEEIMYYQSSKNAVQLQLFSHRQISDFLAAGLMSG